MQTRTYTERSNARRAARQAGLDPDTHVFPCEDGFEVRFVEIAESVSASVAKAASKPNGCGSQYACTYPACKCIVQTSTSQPEPVCPKGLSRPASAESATEPLDGIPEFCKISPEQRKAAWEKNPPRAAPAKPKETITMAKTTKKAKPERASGSDKDATLRKMLSGKGSTVEAMCKALDWLPHTLRARISRLNKPKSKGGEGLSIERTRTDKVTSYRIAS